MDFLKHNSLRRSIAILVGIFSLSPLRVFGIEECESLNIGLEIMIDDTTKVSGLTEYVALVYQFIVGAITIVAAVVIMYWGFRWITAAGNQTIVGNAKEGVVSALIGLVLGLTSYLILFMINASLVSLPTICATGISLQYSGSSWDICKNKIAKNSGECSSVDYCKSTNGCSCGPIQGSPIFYCLPLANNELTENVRCEKDANCKSPLKCTGDSTFTAGQCKQLNYNTPCKDDSTCQSPLTCVQTELEGKCLTLTGRSNGEYCEENNECESNVCCTASNCSINIMKCIDGGLGAYCVDDDQCQWGYTCGDDDKCTEKVVNSSCDKDNGCPSTLHCVDTPGLGSKCLSGAEGVQCENNTHCTPPGAKYCVDNDGWPNFSTCYDGSDNDPCDVNGECASQSCVDNICTPV